MPTIFYAVFTEGALSVLCQGIFETVEDAEKKGERNQVKRRESKNLVVGYFDLWKLYRSARK
jgi:hypothetical protein